METERDSAGDREIGRQRETVQEIGRYGDRERQCRR